MTNPFERIEHLESKVVTEQIDELLAEIDAVLREGRFQSVEEKTKYLHKLYGLVAVNNDSRVREMIHYIEAEYGV